MAGYPLKWTDHHDSARVAESCPYSETDILDYLADCQHHYSLHEPSGPFSDLRFMLEGKSIGRRLWIWQARSPTGEAWWIAIGSGGPYYAYMWAVSIEPGNSAELFLFKARQELDASERR